MKPVVFALTNPITQEWVANSIYAFGASPVMSYHPQEISYVISRVDAGLINLGAIDEERIQAIQILCQERKLPVVLDPAGITFSPLRQQLAIDILTMMNVVIIRGNQDEIQTLYQVASGQPVTSNALLDAVINKQDTINASEYLYKHYGAVVVMTGKMDNIIGSKKMVMAGGSEYNTTITGAGCAMSGALAAAVSGRWHPLRAARRMVHYFNRAAQVAHQRAIFPGDSYRRNFIDSLYRMGMTEQLLQFYAIADFSSYHMNEMISLLDDWKKHGVTSVQWRYKGNHVVQEAKRVLPVIQEAGLPIWVNDFPDIALQYGAVGVHLGQQDGVLATLVPSLKQKMLVGISCKTALQAKLAKSWGADYVGSGALFESHTKSSSHMTLEEFNTIVDTGIPVVGIGGITEERVMTMGAYDAAGFAISDALMRGGNNGRAAAIRSAISHWMTEDIEIHQEDVHEKV